MTDIPEALMLEGPDEPEVDPVDTSWDKIQAMIDKHDEIAATVAGIVQNSEAGITTDDPVSL